MDEVKALRRHVCPECAGEARWNPSKQSLVCAYCGTIVPGQLSNETADIVEHDLAEALRSVPAEQRDWKAEKTSVQCQHCNAISLFDPGRVAQRCDFCGSAAIVPHQEARDAIRPESLLPFKIAQEGVRDLLRQWYGSRWFAPNKLKRAALTDTLKGVYLPYWTFDAQAAAQWNAESGYYYYVSESYRDSNGQTRTRQVRKTRWQPSSGQVHHFFDDKLVCGSVGVRPALLRQIEQFPTAEELVPYDAGYIRGWIVERYQVDLHQAAQMSREIMDRELEALCARQVPGDTHRGLQVSAQYADRKFKHVLLPIWLVTYDYGARSMQVLVNGFSGSVAGERPYSWVKITLAVLGALLVVALIALLSGAFR